MLYPQRDAVTCLFLSTNVYSIDILFLKFNQGPVHLSILSILVSIFAPPKLHPSLCRTQGIMTWDIETASQEWLIDFCERVRKEKGLYGGVPEGGRVLKLSDKIAVKISHGVSPSEAATQEFAYRNVDHSIVRVPRVYRYFVDTTTEPNWPKGYLFMELIPGRTLEELDFDDQKKIIPRLANIIKHLEQVSGNQVPGPVGGGILKGYLWGDYGTRTNFYSVSDMNTWLNKRLILRNEYIDLTPYPLVLCHMDLCRRNIILEEDNKSICLLDWGHAGLFPRFFEFAALSCMIDLGSSIKADLEQAVEDVLGLTEEENHMVKLLQIARAASLRWTL